ncbi:cbb3-type cytochrome oxidase assembly protein CcoS [Ketobacter sp.]|uniref:cbb3-type cytochrome oxidase assembly protein CcoS n=1 Tax=Ketobacter sp. TaxID=2083498 RepID=UPI000F29594C|nr:cbb3-type cytochrome oxidase assembly protein CcoS [Ketobacter sp.]RLT93448.1 MAG: cbb3-type cytochrome oxidase assembly protein CcoS [Ketobacter sp.]
MDIIFLLIPLALVLLVVAVAAFFWAVRSDQFDDLDREASRILFDEDSPPPSAGARPPKHEPKP